MASQRQAASSNLATYADLCALPEQLVGEILDGELVASPRPAVPHANAESVMLSDILTPFHRRPGDPGGPGGWWILAEPEIHLGGDVIVPDVAGWRRERLPRIPRAAFLELAPDWVCEISSPASERIDRLRKMRIYARERVTHVWLVNPLLRTLEAYRLEGENWLRIAAHEGNERVRVEPFAAVELELERWWLEEDGEGEAVAGPAQPAGSAPVL